MPQYKLIVTICALLLQACSTSISHNDIEKVRNEIQTNSKALIKELTEAYPELPNQLANATAYVTINMSNYGLSIVGGGTGIGALFDNEDGSIIYVDIQRFNFGLGLGYSNYEALVLFNSRADIDEFLSGSFETVMSAEMHFQIDETVASTSKTRINNQLPFYVLSKDGAIILGSASLFQSSINHDLTDTGLGATFFANKPVEDEEVIAKEWNRALPFFAQNVVNKGYDLPRPYGISVIYTDTFQAMDINELEVGFNGSQRYPIDFVSFHDNTNSTRSPQLKLDAWLFPFMNVFASVGKIKGEADIQFTIDGNGFLEQSNVDCSKLVNKPVCNALSDKALTVPVVAHLEGTSYTLGTIFAAGWDDYFFVLPLSYTYADMQKTDAEGHIFNASPRFGKQFVLSGLQSISVFVGAGYLDSDLILTGEQGIPGTDAFINYKVHQSNTDKWMGILGANYIFNHDWSIAMEYGKKNSDKHQFISSINYRF
ncbi:hypothetical protein [Shewanella kaireitica]|uniref:hypothetical protein n=1 Tax=Shewanella kaireitica TaxID=212021 RepID=UPI00200E4B49|nr:hypothetical protein [Shewanella kaireitica]MCL1094680.1 hypothetical protein [Shewanella kaireitica]